MATKKKVKRSAPRSRPSPRRAPTPRQQPESFRARGLSTGLTVNDLQRSIAWYRDVLRFTVKDRWEEGGKLMGVELVAGSASVMLNQDDFAKGRDRKKGIGLRLWLSTIQDIDALAKQIKGRGGVLDQEPKDMPWGARLFSISDPDGFKFSVVQER
ncbi:MAG TPA: VOC family protein [Gemmatimonadales bacterium]|nr:VOC family protein [Gemmatimonadales bacterium]